MRRDCKTLQVENSTQFACAFFSITAEDAKYGRLLSKKPSYEKSINLGYETFLSVAIKSTADSTNVDMNDFLPCIATHDIFLPFDLSLHKH